MLKVQKFFFQRLELKHLRVERVVLCITDHQWLDHEVTRDQESERALV